MKVLKVLTLPDIHFPDHDGQAQMLIEKFLADEKPDVLQLLGDAIDFDYISKYSVGNLRKLEGKRIINDYAGFNKMLARWKKLAGNPEVIYHIGNHERRIQDFIDKNPNLEGYAEVEQSVKGVDKFIQFNEVHKIGKLNFMHGIYINQYHAKKHADNYGANIIYGHTHSLQSHTRVSPVNRSHYHTAKSIGCLTNINPSYMKNKPSAWVLAMHMAYIQESGLFSEYTIVINKGQFIWNGKLYKA